MTNLSEKRTLTASEISKGVIHVKADTQYELTSTFMRVQEFYESPYGHIRRQYFSHEVYMDTCAYGTKRSGTKDIVFTYLRDWNGFNVPGEVFDEWSNLFAEHYLWDKEKKLIELVNETISTSSYYVIGTNGEGANGDFEHELSHAWYYLDPEYKKMMVDMTSALSKTALEQIKNHLMDEGYRDSVIEDETVAYLATNTMTQTADMFEKVRIPWTAIYKIQKAFEDYKEDKLDEDN